MEVVNKCWLEFLKLCVGIVILVFYYEGKWFCSWNLILFVNFIKNVFCFKKLYIVLWLMYFCNLENIDENIFEVVMLNFKLKEFEEFSLFCEDVSDWMEW